MAKSKSVFEPPGQIQRLFAGLHQLALALQQADAEHVQSPRPHVCQRLFLDLHLYRPAAWRKC